MFTALAEPFRAIEAVDRELGGPSSRRVTMSTMPSFAAAWLVPRLAMFAQLASADNLKDLKGQSVDYIFTDPPFGSNTTAARDSRTPQPRERGS
jgi:DNA-binding transcriptional LysR family regulator